MLKETITTLFKKYFPEFALIFISVILAFALTEWSSNQGKKVSQEKILLEISNGLKSDSYDVSGNVEAHKNGVNACNFWRRAILENKVVDDSVAMYYFLLTRSVISVQNITAYETLKSKGLEIIENDTLREKIIHLYEFDYEVMRKFEEDYQENQFFDNYFIEINKKIAPNLKFNNKGNIVGLNLPIKLTNDEKNILLSYLWKIQMSRKERAMAGKSLVDKINKLEGNISVELGKRG
jgi:hypothetical protein